MTGRHGDIVGCDPRERLLRVASNQKKLGERRLVEYGDTLPGRLMLAADGVEPVLPLVAIMVLARLPAGKIGKPVRPFPAELLAKASSFRLEPVVKRRAAERTARAILLERPGHRVVLGVSLKRARAHPVRVEMVFAETADVDRPEIVGGLAFGDPLGERHAGATA